MTADSAKPRDEDAGTFVHKSTVHMVFEIERMDGTQAERMRKEQTRAIRGVVQWLAQMRSELGQDRAA